MIQELYGGPLDGKIVTMLNDTVIYTEFPAGQRGCVYGKNHGDKDCFLQYGKFGFLRQMTLDETKRESKR